MRPVPLLATVLALIASAAMALVLTSRGGAEPAAGSQSDARAAGELDTDDLPPPCYGSWDEAYAAGWPTPEPGEEARIVYLGAQETPTARPPFDLYATPVPAGFDSWDEVIDSWIMANDAGLFDPPPVTPEFLGPPPFGCETWEEFTQWVIDHGLMPGVEPP
ncbi:MAG: hypothetical protein WD939_10280 [Dehalococcoidia bacterium]